MDLSLADPCRCVYGVRCSESPVKERDSYRDLSRYNAVPLVGLLGRRGRGTKPLSPDARWQCLSQRPVNRHE